MKSSTMFIIFIWIAIFVINIILKSIQREKKRTQSQREVDSDIERDTEFEDNEAARKIREMLDYKGVLTEERNTHNEENSFNMNYEDDSEDEYNMKNMVESYSDEKNSEDSGSEEYEETTLVLPETTLKESPYSNKTYKTGLDRSTIGENNNANDTAFDTPEYLYSDTNRENTVSVSAFDFQKEQTYISPKIALTQNIMHDAILYDAILYRRGEIFMKKRIK